jgi:predicted nucleotidyltransferase
MSKKTFSKKVKNEIQEYLDVLKADKLPITQVFLFGSYAKGNPNQWSDIDLCVISPKFKDSWKAMQYLWSKRISDSGLTIEPIGFSPKNFQIEDSLVHEIKRTGIEIKI